MITSLESRHLPAVLAALTAEPGVTKRDVDAMESLERYLSRNAGLSLVAHQGEALAGFVLSGHDGRRGYLNHLLVIPEFRRQGIGTRLVESALARLRDAGITKVHVDVLAENNAARDFWLHSGWQLRNDIVRLSTVIAGGINA